MFQGSARQLTRHTRRDETAGRASDLALWQKTPLSDCRCKGVLMRRSRYSHAHGHASRSHQAVISIYLTGLRKPCVLDHRMLVLQQQLESLGCGKRIARSQPRLFASCPTRALQGSARYSNLEIGVLAVLGGPCLTNQCRDPTSPCDLDFARPSSCSIIDWKASGLLTSADTLDISCACPSASLPIFCAFETTVDS